MAQPLIRTLFGVQTVSEMIFPPSLKRQIGYGPLGHNELNELPDNLLRCKALQSLFVTHLRAPATQRCQRLASEARCPRVAVFVCVQNAEQPTLLWDVPFCA